MELMAMSKFEVEIFDPFDMDREEFNPAMCMLRYSRECTLSNILTKKHHIDREIQDLNSDIQNLLYDNYQKIDKVTSVVTNMKGDFSEMEQKMDDLYDQMNGIAKTSSKILVNLQPTENKMLKLLKAQNTVKKLNLLTDLVPTLKMYVDSEIYTAAARCYLKAEKLLKKFSHFPSFNGIVEDCTKVVFDIKVGLRKKLNCEIYKKEELVEILQLLLALQEIPENLLKDFLHLSEEHLENILIKMNEIWPPDKSWENGANFVNKMNSYINSSCNYVEKMSKVLEVANRAFQSKKNFARKLLDKPLEGFFTKHMNCLRNNLLHRIEKYFQVTNDDLLSQVLDKFVRKCHETGVIKTQINFYNEGLDITLQICISRCENILKILKKDFNSKLDKITQELPPLKNISTLILDFVEWTEQKLMSVLLSILHYVRPEFRCCREVTFRKVFCKIAVREATFVAFLKHITEQSWFFLTAENLRYRKPSLCMVLIRFLLDFSRIIPKFLSKVDDYLISTSDDLSLISTEAITKEFKNMSVNIANLYIRTRSQILTDMIEKTMENRDWMASKEPIRPRPVINVILQELLDAKLETEEIFVTCPRPVKKKGSDIGNAILCEIFSNSSKSKENIIEEKVLLNKLFLECPVSSTKVELNASAILNSLLKDILNSFIQLIRLKTLNRFSLQQIQVDLYCMQCQIIGFIEMDSTVQALFDEIMSSAYNRTVNPQMMRSCIVSYICDEFQKYFSFYTE